MKKNRIIFSLTTRGFYSELFNLSLALVYADHYHLRIKLNTWLWNSRLVKGWQDYFEPTLECCNNLLSAQDNVYTKEKPWIGKIYYKPKEFYTFYYRQIVNHLYCLFHPHDLLTKDVFEKMRSDEFIHDILGTKAFGLLSLSYKQIYKLNKETNDYITQAINKLALPSNYIGVHIRRGDKITSEEMHEIRLDNYINTIIQHQEISNNVYIATDDVSVIDYIRTKLYCHDINVYYNSLNNSTGYDLNIFNRASMQERREESINVLLDMEVLINAKFFIGTYTSNLSRVVPFYLGLEKCISLDNDWNIINSSNGL